LKWVLAILPTLPNVSKNNLVFPHHNIITAPALIDKPIAFFHTKQSKLVVILSKLVEKRLDKYYHIGRKKNHSELTEGHPELVSGT